MPPALESKYGSGVSGIIMPSGGSGPDCREALRIMSERVHLIHICIRMHFFMEVYR